MTTHAHVHVLAAAFLLAAVAGCNGNGADLTTTIISTQLAGSEDDADSTSPPDTIRAPAKLGATDQRTRSSVSQPTSNRLSGSAEAESLDPPAATTTGDQAVATSLNKVVTQLVVQRNGRYTFDIVLDVNGVQIRHDGNISIQVAAAILDNAGVAVPMGGITNTTFDFTRNPAGGTAVRLGGSETGTEATMPNGDYDKTVSGAVNLAPGNYRVEFDLRIRATAPVQFGPDGQRHRAEVRSATATITVR